MLDNHQPANMLKGLNNTTKRFTLIQQAFQNMMPWKKLFTCRHQRGWGITLLTSTSVLYVHQQKKGPNTRLLFEANLNKKHTVVSNSMAHKRNDLSVSGFVVSTSVFTLKVRKIQSDEAMRASHLVIPLKTYLLPPCCISTRLCLPDQLDEDLPWLKQDSKRDSKSSIPYWYALFTQMEKTWLARIVATLTYNACRFRKLKPGHDNISPH